MKPCVSHIVMRKKKLRVRNRGPGDKDEAEQSYGGRERCHVDRRNHIA